MKKVLAGMLSTVMLCMALAGCGGQQAASDANVDDLAYIQENGTLKIGRISWLALTRNWPRLCARNLGLRQSSLKLIGTRK